MKKGVFLIVLIMNIECYGQRELFRQSASIAFDNNLKKTRPYVNDHYIAVDEFFTGPFSGVRDSLAKYFSTGKAEKVYAEMKNSASNISFPCIESQFICVDSIFRRKLEIKNIQQTYEYYAKAPRTEYCVLSFSRPIYMDEYAIIQVNTFAHNLNADSFLLLFKKTNNNWKLITYLASMAS